MERKFRGVGDPDAVLAAFRGMPALGIVLSGPDLEIVAVNETFSRFVGDRDVLGRPYREAVPEAENQGIVELAERVFDTGEPFDGHEWRVQVDLPGLGVVERYLDLRLLPWYGDDDAVRGVIGEAEDVTEHVLARHAADRRRQTSRRYVHLRDLTLTLQDTLLPDGLPILPGLQIAGSYLLAEEDLAAGGDWLDVVPLGESRAALIVGDVVGHGVEASGVMGQLRAICEERLTAGAGVVGTMAALDRYASRQVGARSTTLTLVELDTSTGRMEYCTAGHPPPLVLHDEYESRFLAPTGAGPIGLGAEFPVQEDRLGPGELLLLYTDGIIERPERQPTRATVELAQVAGRAVRGTIFRDEQPPADRACRQTIELLTRETGYADDITLLAVQRVPVVQELQFEMQADPGVLGDVRNRLAAWLSVLDPSPLDQMALQHAVGELVTNVVEHAYPPGTGHRPVCVTLSLDHDGMAVATVEDHGRWRPKLDESHGSRGLPMVNGLMDEVSVERRGNHTTITVRHRLSRSIALMKGVSTSVPEVDLPAYETSYDDNVLSVSGVVDLTSAEELRRDLNLITTAGHDQTTVDLTEVELLASAGVQVLFEARGQAARQGVAVHFRAARGTVAQHVLGLVNLPVETRAQGSDGRWDDLPPL